MQIRWPDAHWHPITIEFPEGEREQRTLIIPVEGTRGAACENELDVGEWLRLTPDQLEIDCLGPDRAAWPEPAERAVLLRDEIEETLGRRFEPLWNKAQVAPGSTLMSRLRAVGDEANWTDTYTSMICVPMSGAQRESSATMRPAGGRVAEWHVSGSVMNVVFRDRGNGAPLHAVLSELRSIIGRYERRPAPPQASQRKSAHARGAVPPVAARGSKPRRPRKRKR